MCPQTSDLRFAARARHRLLESHGKSPALPLRCRGATLAWVCPSQGGCSSVASEECPSHAPAWSAM